jgi:uncharacterized membrane protein
MGPLSGRVPNTLQQLIIGVLLHEKKAIVDKDRAALTRDTQGAPSQDWIAAFKAVLLEGLEVVFIMVAVVAVGTGRAMPWPASLGALVACALVLAVRSILHRPLSQVPKNAVKFGVGVRLSASGAFWTGEGLGVDWPGVTPFGLSVSHCS